MTASNDAIVADVQERNGRLDVSCTGAPATFSFVGQGGVVRKTVTHATSAEYDLTASDTYVRTVIRAPTTVMFLNPIVRYDGAALPTPVALVDERDTWFLRGLLAIVCAAAMAVLWRRGD